MKDLLQINQNRYMYTKSIIQQKAEIINAKNNFKQSLEQLMEKFNIEDSVFVYAGNVTGMKEIVEGYFVIDAEYDNINEAMSECDINTMGIRIIENDKFQVGKIHTLITECEKDKKVFDLKRLKDVR